MEAFMQKLAEAYAKAGAVAKGTASNMKRGLDGTAMREMQAAERARNESLINNAMPGGVPAYMAMQGTTTPTSTPPAAQQPGYLQALRALLTKP